MSNRIKIRNATPLSQIAYRAWGVDRDGLLASPFTGSGTPWPGPRFRTRCIHPGHRRPTKGCNCGIHVHPDEDWVHDQARFHEWPVITRVRVLGLVLPASHGDTGELRVEEVVLDGVALVDTEYAGWCDKLTARYGIPFERNRR